MILSLSLLLSGGNEGSCYRESFGIERSNAQNAGRKPTDTIKENNRDPKRLGKSLKLLPRVYIKRDLGDGDVGESTRRDWEVRKATEQKDRALVSERREPVFE